MIPNKIVTIFIGVFLTLGSLYLAILSWNAIKAHDYIGVSEQQRHSIAITGEGKVSAVPDIAKIQLGYSAEKKTVADAQKDNSAKMNAINEKLKKDFGIDQKDIKTVSYNIYPQYDWSNNKQTLRGYQVSQSLEVKIRAMDQVSKILDVSGQIGLNQIGSLFFEVDDPEKIKQEAREIALEQAKLKAGKLADIAGVKLGKIISFSESGNYPATIVRDYAMKEAYGIGGASSAPSVEAGSTDFVIVATVEYEIL